MMIALLTACTIGLTLCFLISLGAAHFWIGELLVHFMSQYLWISALCVCFALYLRHVPLSIAGSILTLAVFGYMLWTNHQTAVFVQDDLRTPSITVATYNKFYGNENTDQITAWLHQDDAPDIAVIHEMDLETVDKLIANNPDYAYSDYIKDVKYPRNRSLILSRLPIAASEEVTIDDGYKRIYLKAAISPSDDLAFPAFTLFAMHPKTPMFPANWKVRNDEFEKVAEDVKNTEGPIVVVGDMNCTPYSPAFRNINKTADLRFITSSLVPKPTWPAQLLLAPLQIRIDHVLISDDFAASDVRRISPMGSDHYPLEIRLHPRPMISEGAKDQSEN